MEPCSEVEVQPSRNLRHLIMEIQMDVQVVELLTLELYILKVHLSFEPGIAEGAMPRDIEVNPSFDTRAI